MHGDQKGRQTAKFFYCSAEIVNVVILEEANRRRWRPPETTDSRPCRGDHRAAPPPRSPWRYSTMRLYLPPCSTPSPPFSVSPPRSKTNARVLLTCVRPIYHLILIFFVYFLLRTKIDQTYDLLVN